MGDAVETLLQSWGVPQLASRLREEEVDVDALRCMSDELISELVPRIGPRSKFLRGLRAWKLASGGSASPAQPEYNRNDEDAAGERTTPVHRPPDRHEPSPGTSVQGDTSTAGENWAKDMFVSFDLGTLSFGANDERSVGFEGKLEKQLDGSLWLTASGVQMPPTNDDWDNQGIKVEPEENENSGRKFQLEGRMAFSNKENQIVEIPAFFLGQHTSAKSLSLNEGVVLDDSRESSQYSEDTVLSQAQAQGRAAASYCMATSTTSMATSMPGTSSSSTSSSRKRGWREAFDLPALLNSTSKGKMVLSTYRQKGSLDGPARQSLTDLIIAEELREDFDKRITSQRFQEMAAAIVELFPGENEDTYFACDRTDGDRPLGKGKLSSKYYNTRRQLAKSGVLSKSHQKERRQVQPASLFFLQMDAGEETAARFAMDFLRMAPTKDGTLEMYLGYWKASWKKRMTSVLSQSHQPSTYVDHFPVLLHSFAPPLVCHDFERLFNQDGQHMMRFWPVFSESVIKIVSEDYRKQNPLLERVRSERSPAARQAGALLLLPSLCPVTTCKGGGEGNDLWRPTRQEAQDAFLLYVENEFASSVTLGRFYERMASLGQRVCPVPVVVGSLEHTETAYVSLDRQTRFEVKSAPEAVDLCFKLFHALQVGYPPQAQNVWLFLQHAVYGVATPHDKMSVTVSSLLADFGIRPVPPVVSWDQLWNSTHAALSVL